MNLTTRTSLTALAALCSAAAIGPASAPAAQLVTYDVQVDSATLYDLTQQTRDDLGSFNAATRFSWAEAADLQRVQFLDGYLVHGAAAYGTASAEGHSEEIRTRKDAPTQSGSCDIDADKQQTPSVMLDKPDSQPGQNEAIAVTVADGEVDLDWKCQGQIGSYIPGFGSKPIDPEGEFGQRPMDATFTIPREIVGYGKIIQRIHGPEGRSAGYCPEEYAEGVTECDFDWDGEVTFTKVAEQTVGGPTPAPAHTQPVPAPVAKPADDELEELAPLVVPSAKALTDAKASKVSFSAQCPAGCSGSAALSVPGAAKGGAAAAVAKPVATMRFTGKGNGAKPRLITLTLPAKARRALRRGRRGSLRVILKQPGRVAVMRTLRVKVPRR